jgi:uncharacterized membrane protein (UPF0182 family)
VAGVAVLIIILASLKSLATLYTDSLWFSSVGQHGVWSTLLAVKVGLFASFGAAFFVMLWVNLLICDRLGATAPPAEADEELVRRYQQAVRPYSRRVYAAIALLLALIAASGTIGEWQNWILFRHGVNFGVRDPQFHRDVGFFVFKLPFLTFLYNWTLISLVVILVITAIFHYLNGGIRAQRAAPRVRPSVKVHLSVLLALIALVKAVGYVLQRFQLDVSSNGYVQGAGYTDVHARLPALSLLFWISLAAAVVLLYNIRRKGWTLPVLAIGVWAFVALVVGVIYPAVLQALKVNPAQSTLEAPYIKRNIEATRAAYGLNQVTVTGFAGNSTLAPQTVVQNKPTLDNVRLWDPDPQISLQTFQKLQGIRSYYIFPTVSTDRYTVGGNLTPTLIGVREISTNLPSSSWVNTHLQYTHGEGVALAESNQALANGNPAFSIQNVPPISSGGLPQVTQPDVYFGLGLGGYVVADTRQAEYNFQLPNGNAAEGHYQGGGGVQMNSFLTRAAFAIRLGDFNLLISNLITAKSRIMFVRDIQAMVQKAAPFMTFDSDPYAAVVDGHIDWVIDGYVTTSQYPYSQNANTVTVPQGSGLPGSYNYVRNAVKVVINSYSGHMTFYAMDKDPILRTYEAAFPHLFTPASKMSAELRAHLRYPEDIFSAQAALLGRYHIVNPTSFYTAGNAWNVSPTVGAGPPGQALAVTQTTNAQGLAVTGPLQPMSPLYQVLQEPGEHAQSFTLTDAYVPTTQGNQGTAGNQNLTAFLMANADPSHYGKLTLFVTPGQPVLGPAQANSEIQANAKVSQQITLLDQHGSQVLLGNILMVPIGQSMLYVRPLYVTSTSNSLPALKFIIAVFGQHVGIESTLNAALNDVLGVSLQPSASGATSTPSSNGTSPIGSAAAAKAEQDLKQAAADYTQAQAYLKQGGAGALGNYQSEIDAMNELIVEAEALLNGGATSSGTAAPPGGAAPKPGSTSTSTGGPGSTSGSHASSSSHSSSSGSSGSSGSPSSPTTTTSPPPPTTTTTSAGGLGHTTPPSTLPTTTTTGVGET